jgi:hypothetical protein
VETISSICVSEIGQMRLSLSIRMGHLLQNGVGPIDPETASVRIDSCRTFRPQGPDQIEPAFQPLPKLAWPAVIGAAQLTDQPRLTKQGHPLPPFRNEAR